MTDTTPEDDYGYEGDKCCAGCTCKMAHSSVPPVE